MEKAARLRAEGWTRAQTAVKLGVSAETVRDDWSRLRELRREEALGALEEHLDALRALKRRAYEELDRTELPSLNRATILSQIRQIEMDLARLDGSLQDRVKPDLEAPRVIEIHHVPAGHRIGDDLPPLLQPERS